MAFIFFLNKSQTTEIVEECEVGCLLCDSNKVCKVCDWYNGYLINSTNNQCQNFTIFNCQFLWPYLDEGQNPKCYQCFDEYYLDNNQCVKVTDLTRVDNCLLYESDILCKVCMEGYLLANNKLSCDEVTNPIENCLTHESILGEICVRCNDGYVFSVNRDSCLIDPETRFCQAYSYSRCEKCQNAGYIDENSQLFYYYGLDTTDLMNYFTREIDNLSNKLTTIQPTICLYIEDLNCISVNQDGECLACAEGFFLNTSGICQANPAQPIPHCAVYQDLISCKRCQDGYHLNGTILCVANTDIPNCQDYDPASQETSCLACKPTHVLSNNKCPQRKVVVDECQEYVVDKEQCLICTDGRPTDDGLKCLDRIQNCIDYEPSTYLSPVLVCIRCSSIYFVDQGYNLCSIGSDQNCAIFEDNVDVCRICNNTYYVKDGICTLHSADIEFCEIYSTTDDLFCDTCEYHAILVQNLKDCDPISRMDFCVEYGSPDQCIRCEDGYELFQDICVPIHPILNCLQAHESLCTKCENGYLLIDGFCFMYAEFLNYNCASNNVDGLTSVYSCNYCDSGYIPFDIYGYYICEDKPEFDSIPNCTKFEEIGEELLCRECAIGYILSNDNKSCLFACPSNTTHYFQSFDSNNTELNNIYYHKCRNDINFPVLTGCESATLDARTLEPICIKCQDGYVATNACKTSLSIFDSNENFSNYEQEDLGANYAAVSCIEQGSSTFLPLLTTNCELWEFDFQQQIYYCQKCVFGTTGTIIKDVNTQLTYVDCNTPIEGCNTDVKYGGAQFSDIEDDFFESTHAHLFSCNLCQNADEIPFVFLDQFGNLRPFGLEPETQRPVDANVLNGKLNACLKPNAQSLVVDVQNFVSFPQNCGIGYYSVNQSKHVELGKPSVHCFACKPGYSQITNNLLIQQCVKIENCDNDNQLEGWFNSCRQCKQGYTWLFINDQIEFNQCIPTGDLNCLAVDSNEQCQICKKGYWMNKDSKCELIAITQCSEFNFEQSLYYNDFNTNHQGFVYQYLSPKGQGCNVCTDGKSSIKYNESTEICVSSEIVQSRLFYNDSLYIENCLNYSATGFYNCEICSIGYIPNESKNLCFEISSNPKFLNCSFVQNTGNDCGICEEGQILINGACEIGNILNCKVYYQNTDSQDCETCHEGYYVLDNKCQVGEQPFCRVYQNFTGDCQTCDEGFALGRVGSENKPYCFQISIDLNCSNGEFNDDTNEFVCSQCYEYFFLNEPTQILKNVCFGLNLVDFCIAYNNINFGVTMTCIQCEDEYYLDTTNNQCILRQENYTGCITRNLTADQCDHCESSYFLIDGLCDGNPNGILHCIKYQDENTCVRCKAHYYLDTNICEVVSKPVSRCFYYLENNICEQCKNNLALVNNECLDPIAQNCLTYVNQFECATCAVNYGLKLNETNQAMDCVPVFIEFCILSTQTFPFECLLCDSDHYVFEGECDDVVNISQCLEYSGVETCSKCAIGYKLHADKVECIPLSDQELVTYQNCESVVEEKEPICVLCNYGYIFDQGICIDCLSNDLESGCAFCNPRDQSLCMICKPGFYMKTDSTCIANPDLQSINPGNPFDDSNADIIKLIYTLLMVILVFS